MYIITIYIHIYNNYIYGSHCVAQVIVFNPWAQATLLLQPPELLGLQECAIILGLAITISMQVSFRHIFTSPEKCLGMGLFDKCV